MKIALIAGHPAVLHCGVKDYAQGLAEALAPLGIAASVEAPVSWSPPSAMAFWCQLRRRRYDVLHLQYPSLGFRSSLAPHLLSAFGRRTVVTLHEHTRLPRPQRWANHLFRRADALIFTTPAERAAFGPTRTLTEVIPIAANVPVAQAQTRGNTVVCFGQIRPDKGLEDFLTLAANPLLSHLDFAILGAAPPRHQPYLARLQALAPRIEWHLNLPPAAVADHLARAMAAYLPFPDGATYRRGSLLACLANGTPVLAPVAAETPPELAAALLPAATPAEAARHLLRLDWRYGTVGEQANQGRVLGQEFTWPAIAQAHAALYDRLNT